MSYTSVDIENSTQSEIIRAALIIAKTIVDRPGLYYSQQRRWGPNSYDCSSLMFTIWQDCYNMQKTLWNEEGINHGVKDYANSHGLSLSTLGLRAAFMACGFIELDKSVMNGSNPIGLQPGDVLLMSHPHEMAHTAMIYGRDSGGQLYFVESGGQVSEGPSRGGSVGFSRYWNGGYWQYAFRCMKGFTNATKALDKLLVEMYVDKLYRTLLNREPDPDGYNTWTDHFFNSTTGKQNNSVYAALSGIIASEEYKKKPYTNKQYVTQLYKLILGREPDPSGLDTYVKILNDNPEKVTVTVEGKTVTITTRAYVLWALCYSDEAQSKSALIPSLYGVVMTRSGDVDKYLHLHLVPLVTPPAITLYYNLDGIWKKASNVYVHNGTGWQKATGTFVKQDMTTWVGG